MASIGQTGRSMKMAFAKYGTNSWGVAASVTKGIYFQSDGGQQYQPGMIQDPSFNQAFLGDATPGLVESPNISYAGRDRYNDHQYILEALAMGSPAAPAISDSTSGQTTSWTHQFDLSTDIDGLGATFAIDKVQYVEEMTSAKVIGFTLTQEDNGAMQQEFQIQGSKISDISSTNINSTVGGADFPALTNRIVQQQGVFRINLNSAGALAAGDAIQAESISLTFERPQDAPHVYGQDFIAEPADQGHPTAVIEITRPRMNTIAANSAFAGIKSGVAYKADWTFTGAFINSADNYTKTYEFPYLQFMPDGFLATAEEANQVKPVWRLMANLATTSPTGMALVNPMRLTRTMATSITAF